MAFGKLTDKDFKSNYRRLIEYQNIRLYDLDFDKLETILKDTKNKHKKCLKKHTVIAKSKEGKTTIIPIPNIFPTIYCNTCGKVLLNPPLGLIKTDYKKSNSNENIELYISKLINNKIDINDLFIEHSLTSRTDVDYISDLVIYLYVRALIINEYPDFFKRINMHYYKNPIYYTEEICLVALVKVIYLCIYLSSTDDNKGLSDSDFIDKVQFELFMYGKKGNIITIRDFIDYIYTTPELFDDVLQSCSIIETMIISYEIYEDLK